MSPAPPSTRIHWTRFNTLLEETRRNLRIEASEDLRTILGFGDSPGPEIRLTPPLLLASEDGKECPPLLASPGRHALILFQAGAAALGLWNNDRILAHKVFKRYVVRGSGRAQPGYLKTRGKSRYGSRLRLRNAERLLCEVRERLGEWFTDQTPVERLFYSCPVALRRPLLDPPAKVSSGDGPPWPSAIRIPLDVRIPTHKELLHIHYELSHGTLEESPFPGR